MILTLGISGFALVLSVVSLGWQVVSWRRNGPRVKVVRIQGIGPGRPQGVWFIGVEARNSGRLGTQVQQFGFQLPNHQVITVPEDFMGRPIGNMDLPPGGTASAMYNARDIRDALAEHRITKKVRPFVVTGHGRFEGKRVDLVGDVNRQSRFF